MRQFLILIVAVAGLASCAGESEELLTKAQLRRMVLQPADLTGPWTRFDEGRQLSADALPGPRSDPTRFDRQDGWKARYRRPGSAETEGPLVVESRADLFAETSGAEQDFDAASEDLGDRAESVELGAEARHAATPSSAPGQFVTMTVVWRERNVVAALTVNGFSGKLTLDDVLALARKQQRRIEAARS